MSRQRWLTTIVVLVGILTIPAVAFAASGGNGNGTDHFAPVTVTTPDGGSCGVAWNNETFERNWSVHDNGDGTFLVTREDKQGTFETIDGPSPGACSTSQQHGSTVAGGITGQMSGFWQFDVTSSSYNPAGCDVAGTDCGTTSGFLATVFPGMTDSCSTVCQWNFEYSSSDPSLVYHHWQDRSDATGGNDIFVGDIATQ